MPKTIPPKCAKCATLSSILFRKPIDSSISPYTITKYFAFIGIGGISISIIAFGNVIPKASKSPYTAPEAPTVGMLVRNSTTSFTNTCDWVRLLYHTYAAEDLTTVGFGCYRALI